MSTRVSRPSAAMRQFLGRASTAALGSPAAAGVVGQIPSGHPIGEAAQAFTAMSGPDTPDVSQLLQRPARGDLEDVAKDVASPPAPMPLPTRYVPPAVTGAGGVNPPAERAVSATGAEPHSPAPADTLPSKTAPKAARVDVQTSPGKPEKRGFFGRKRRPAPSLTVKELLEMFLAYARRNKLMTGQGLKQGPKGEDCFGSPMTQAAWEAYQAAWAELMTLGFVLADGAPVHPAPSASSTESGTPSTVSADTVETMVMIIKKLATTLHGLDRESELPGRANEFLVSHRLIKKIQLVTTN